MAVVLQKSEILTRIEKNRERLRSLGVQRLGLFGSYLRGEAEPGSDVDLLVRLDTPSFDAYMDTKFLLEDAFGLPVDLVMEGALKPALEHVRDEAAYVSGF